MVDRPFWKDKDPETGRDLMSMTLTDRLKKNIVVTRQRGTPDAAVAGVSVKRPAGLLEQLPQLPVKGEGTHFSASQLTIEQAGQAGASLTAIGQALRNLNGLNASIASATLQQAHVVEDINQNVTQAAGLSHSTALAAQQSSVASTHLRTLSEQLDGLLRQFKV